MVKSGYAYDGPSGPTIDTKSSMRGSLAHDALYQLIRQGYLPGIARIRADNFMHKCFIEDGMWRWRASSWRKAVSKFAVSAADPKNKKKVYEAP